MYKVDVERRALPLRYRNLKPNEIAVICNGCGGKGGWVKPPQFRFNASCNHHDFNYWLGTAEEHRTEADRQFIKAMHEDAAELPWYRRWYHHALAEAYHAAVRCFGKGYFHYAARERTWDDLEEAMTLAINDG